MKFFGIALFVLILGLSSARVINDNGQPGCKFDAEMVVQYFRNIWDPTRYWSCVTKGCEAVSVKCPDGLAWLDSVKNCVEWENWDWEQPTPPLSTP